MRIYPWFVLYRRRLIGVAVMAILIASFFVFLVCFTPCDCPQNYHGDATVLSVALSFGAIAVGAILSIGIVGNKPGMKGHTIFLFTRPALRHDQLVQPLLIATPAIALLPALAWAVVLAALRLVHVAWLAHMLAVVETAPSVAGLGPHPSFLLLMAALHIARRSVAAASVGLCVYAIYAAQRWLLLSDSKRLNALAILPALAVPSVPFWRFVNHRALSALLLFPPPGGSLDDMPSTFAIAAHLAFAAAVLWGCWELVKRVEI